jgi:hypothetical protein
MALLYPGRPLNMNPEDYVRLIADTQASTIATLEARLQSEGASPRQTVLEYMFSATLVEPPSTQQMRIDALAAAITKVWVHKTTNTGIDIANVFTLFHNGDRVYIQTKNDSTCNSQLRLRAEPIFKTNHIELPVTYLTGGAALKGGQVAIIALTPLT